MAGRKRDLEGRVRLVLDLETVTDPRLADLELDREGKKRFPPPAAHRIVCCGYAWLRGAEVLTWGVMTESEELILAKLARSIEKADPQLVTVNGRHFDLPVIVARCLGAMVPFPWYWAARAPRYRYDPSAHLDLQDYLADYGAPKVSLDGWSRLCGWPGKGEIDGRDVAGLLETGGVEAVADYCAGDVCQTCALLIRFLYVSGEIGGVEYERAARRLLEVAEVDVRTAGIAARVDRARWLGTVRETELTAEELCGEEEAAE